LQGGESQKILWGYSIYVILNQNIIYFDFITMKLQGGHGMRLLAYPVLATRKKPKFIFFIPEAGTV
jgi:hypothetical protein